MIKESFKQVLDKWEFPIIEETETRIVFRYQMYYIYLNVNLCGKDNNVSVQLAGNFIPDEKERILALRTCNDLNSRLFQMKYFLVADAKLIISMEFYCSDDENFEEELSMILQNIIIAKQFFTRRYRELDQEAKLLSELEQDGDCDMVGEA